MAFTKALLNANNSAVKILQNMKNKLFLPDQIRLVFIYHPTFSEYHLDLSGALIIPRAS